MKFYISILMTLFVVFGFVNVGQEAVCVKDIKFEQKKIAILKCESQLKHHNVWGDHGKSYGIAQFQLKTFNYLKTLANKPELRWKNCQDQLWLFDWALKNGYGKNWTCYRKCSNRRNS